MRYATPLNPDHLPSAGGARYGDRGPGAAARNATRCSSSAAF